MRSSNLTPANPGLQFTRAPLGSLTLAVAIVLLWTGMTPSPVGAKVISSDRVAGQLYRELKVPKAAMPDVSVRSGALFTQDGRELWSRRGADRVSMASLTKIMTAVVASEHTKPTDTVTIPVRSTQVGESTSFLRPGETLPMTEMYEALLVKSGNDAAYAIAEHVAGSEAEFVKLMNAKASELGLDKTKFANSHGLDAQGHYSTPRDLAVLARYAMTRPEIRSVAGKKTAKIGSGKRAETFFNTNLLIGNYDGANGLKTGWTGDAGYCVVVSAERDGIELYAVVMGSSSELQRFRDARALLDFGFAHYRPQRIASAGTVIGEALVEDYLDRYAPAAASQDTTIAVFDLSGPISRNVSMSTVRAPIEVGERIGVATYVQNGQIIETVPLVATTNVPKPTLLQRVGIALLRTWRALANAE